MQQSLKNLIPSNLKTRVKVLQRDLVDGWNGVSRQFVKPQPLINEEKELYQHRLTISQEIKPSSYVENKVHNLKTAIACIEDVPIHPGEIFSFWRLVGEPSEKNGYREGRAIVNDELKTNMGGGLCQLSGAIYFLILKAGLLPLERHPHSQDIYTEETRFAPLGSDATVVYGYKDLRFKNTLTVPICFRFTLRSKEIAATLCAVQPIEEFQIAFQIEPMEDNAKKVTTLRLSRQNQDGEAIATTLYPTLTPK